VKLWLGSHAARVAQERNWVGRIGLFVKRWIPGRILTCIWCCS
jgi:hypothetical protein